MALAREGFRGQTYKRSSEVIVVFGSSYALRWLTDGDSAVAKPSADSAGL